MFTGKPTDDEFLSWLLSFVDSLHVFDSRQSTVTQLPFDLITGNSLIIIVNGLYALRAIGLI